MESRYFLLYFFLILQHCYPSYSKRLRHEPPQIEYEFWWFTTMNVAKNKRKATGHTTTAVPAGRRSTKQHAITLHIAIQTEKLVSVIISDSVNTRSWIVERPTCLTMPLWTPWVDVPAAAAPDDPPVVVPVDIFSSTTIRKRKRRHFA